MINYLSTYRYGNIFGLQHRSSHIINYLGSNSLDMDTIIFLILITFSFVVNLGQKRPTWGVNIVWKHLPIFECEGKQMLKLSTCIQHFSPSHWCYT